jgi:hypothetical protein
MSDGAFAEQTAYPATAMPNGCDEPAYRALMDEVMGKGAQRPDDIAPLHERVG